MRRMFLAITLTALSVPGLAEAFTFRTPQGWLDLSPGAPAENFEGLPPEVVAQARSGTYVAMGFDVDHGDDGFTENFNARVHDGAQRLTEPAVEGFANALAAQGGRQQPGNATRVLEHSVVTVGGVHFARVVMEATVGGFVTRQIVYLIPGAGQMASVTYSTTPRNFARYQPIFDAAAAATVGAVEPVAPVALAAPVEPVAPVAPAAPVPPAEPVTARASTEPESAWQRIANRSLLGAVVGGLVGVVAWFSRRRKSA